MKGIIKIKKAALDDLDGLRGLQKSIWAVSDAKEAVAKAENDQWQIVPKKQSRSVMTI